MEGVSFEACCDAYPHVVIRKWLGSKNLKVLSIIAPVAPDGCG
jgi:hypothetical protein